MKYLYWISAAAVVAIGLYIATSVRFEVPTSTRILFQQYESPDALAMVLQQNFQTELQAHAVVFLGVTPEKPEDIELWQAFLNQLKGTPNEFQVVVAEKKLPYVENIPGAVAIDVTTERQRFVEGIELARQQNLRTAVILPYHYSSQMIAGNPVNVLKTQGWDILSLTALKFPVTRQQESTFQPACLLEERQDPAKTGTLGCTVIRFSQKTYQEKFLDNQYSSFTEQISPTDFLILMNRNSGSR